MNKIGDIVEGRVTGIKPYGAFISFDNDIVGLLHISEISENYVKNINSVIKFNELIKIKIIDIDNENKQYKLSLKAIKSKSTRKFKKNKNYGSIPEIKVGFKSLEDNLDKWIKEARKND